MFLRKSWFARLTQSVHKIQSSSSLDLHLEQVPKVIKPLTQWAEHGFIVSFKLETDLPRLIPKSRAALQRYEHQLVIANLLETRKSEVWFVTNENSEHITLDNDTQEIESLIIPKLVQLHHEWINKQVT